MDLSMKEFYALAEPYNIVSFQFVRDSRGRPAMKYARVPNMVPQELKSHWNPFLKFFTEGNYYIAGGVIKPGTTTTVPVGLLGETDRATAVRQAQEFHACVLNGTWHDTDAVFLEYVRESHSKFEAAWQKRQDEMIKRLSTVNQLKMG